MQKNNNRFLKIKIKKRGDKKQKKKKKENSTELKKDNIQAEVYNSNKNCD